jgi:hypothetical protein
MLASYASHSRAALSTTVSSTGWKSVGEREITFIMAIVRDLPPPPNSSLGNAVDVPDNSRIAGIPLWRQDLMTVADEGVAKSIRMMGQETGQRSTLTVNNGTYYLDTTVDKTTQLTQDCTSNDLGNPCVVNVFQKNQSYYLFLIFARETTKQTYRFYVGDSTDFDPASIQLVQAPIGKNPINFTELGALPAGRARWLNNDKATANGVVEVELRAMDLPGLSSKITTAEKNKCQPSTFCHWDTSAKVPECVDANGSADVCRWAVADLDCPDGGCVGIKFTLPQGFATRPSNDPRPNPRPPAVCVAKAAPWDESLYRRKVFDCVCPVEADNYRSTSVGSKGLPRGVTGRRALKIVAALVQAAQRQSSSAACSEDIGQLTTSPNRNHVMSDKHSSMERDERVAQVFGVPKCIPLHMAANCGESLRHLRPCCKPPRR